MIKYINEKELEKVLKNNDELIMVFGKGINCGVCHAVENRINQTYPDKYPTLKIYYLIVEENPLFRGTHLIFSVPTIMLFDGSKEIARESRIIDFRRLEKPLNMYFN